MRKLGVDSPTEPLVGAYASELRPTDGGQTILPRDKRMVVAGVRLPIGTPVELGFTAAKIAFARTGTHWMGDRSRRSRLRGRHRRFRHGRAVGCRSRAGPRGGCSMINSEKSVR
jgi:hypothetical protein